MSKIKGTCPEQIGQAQFRNRDEKGHLLPPTEEQIEARFWSKVEEYDECWVWLAGTFNAKGFRYGAFGLGRNNVGAHRFAYEKIIGPIPEGHNLDHLCENQLCVNPFHLSCDLGNRANVIRGRSPVGINARKETCLNGHEFIPRNNPEGREWRRCGECARIRMQKYRAQRK